MLHLAATRVSAPVVPRASRPASFRPAPVAFKSLKATFVCKAAAEEPAKDAAADKKDEEPPVGPDGKPLSRAAAKRAKFLANVKIPDASEAQTRKVAKERD